MEIQNLIMPNDLKEKTIFEDRLPSDPNKDPEFGIPEEKKFPLYDAKHVRSAIRFFNYASPSQRKSLASRIKAKMKEYGIPSSTIGKDNALRDYLPKRETASVSEGTWSSSIESQYSAALANMLFSNQQMIDDINIKLGLGDDDLWSVNMDDGSVYLTVKSKAAPSKDLIQSENIYADQMTGPDAGGFYKYTLCLNDKPGFVANKEDPHGSYWHGTHSDNLFEADNMKSLGQAVGDVAKGDISSGKQKSAEELFSERQKENEAEEAADFDKKHPNLSRMTKDYEKSGGKITSRDSKHGSFKVKTSDGHTHYVYHSTNGGYSKQEADGTGKIVSHLHSSDGKAWK